MQIINTENYAEMSKEAARLVAATLRLEPEAVLGLATGSTPQGLYAELVRMYREEGLDFSEATTFNLDEYVGIGPEHEQSYRYYMDTNLFNHINIDKDNTFVPLGLTEDIEGECEIYDELMDMVGGTDIQILGIGENGHIGFNEPGSVFVASTHVTDLTESTIEANSRLFAKKEDVPRRAITMGMRGIMSANMIIILASGEKKAQAVRDMVLGPVTPECPASLLQLHPQVLLIADDEALSGIEF